MFCWQTEEGKTPAVKTAEELAAEAEHVSDVLSQLTPEEIKRVMNSLFDEMLTGLKVGVILINNSQCLENKYSLHSTGEEIYAFSMERMEEFFK